MVEIGHARKYRKLSVDLFKGSRQLAESINHDCFPRNDAIPQYNAFTQEHRKRLCLACSGGES